MKKLFAILMSVIMIVAFMPSMAFAGGEAPAFIAEQTYSSDNWTNNGKFRLEISSGEANAFAEVYDDYSVLGKVVGEEVDSTSALAKVTMKNVASLGLKDGETRTHKVEFGIPKQIKPSLPAFFPHIFGCGNPQSSLYPNLTDKDVKAFSGATLTGKVNDYGFTYTVSAVTKKTETINEKATSVYTMTATPNSTDAVRKAWHELTSKVEATKASDETNDSKIEIPEGAYLQIGDQKLLFEKNCTVNPSDKTSGGANKVIREAARLLGPDNGIKPLENNVQMYIPKGSVLRVGDSIATLKAGIYIKSNSKAVIGDDLIALKGDPTKPADEQLVSMILAAIKITDSAVADIDNNDLGITILTECYVTVEGSEESTTYIYDDPIVLPEAPAASEGKVFAGWTDEAGNPVKAGDPVREDITLKAVFKDKNPGGNTGGGGGPAVVPPATDNVTNNAADKNTTADLTPAVKDNKAETTVDAKTADKIVEKALENKSEEIIVDAAGNNTVASSEVGIPEKTVKEIAEKTDAKLVIKTDNGKVDLDKAAVKAVADQAGTTGTVKLIVETVKNDADICHVNLKLVTSNGAVTDFKGGNVKVTINLTKELAAKELVCVYIDDNGIYTLVEGVLNADGTYTFTTGHFSEYAVMAKAEADKKIAEQLDTMIKDVNLKVRTSKTAKKNIKAVVSGDVKALTDAGYTVKYKFYRSEKKASKYVAKATKAGKTYVNTAGKKGTKYYYKAKALVYDGDKLVGQTVLKQCKYGARTWSK